MTIVTAIVYTTLALIAAMVGIGILVGFVLWMRILMGVAQILIPVARLAEKPQEPEEKKPNTYLRMSQEP